MPAIPPIVITGVGEGGPILALAGRPAGWAYVWDPSTSSGDPGPGKVRLNSASFPGVNQMFISDFDADTNGLTGEIASWYLSNNIKKCRLKIFQTIAPTNFALYDVLGGGPGVGWHILNLAAIPGASYGGAFIPNQAVTILPLLYPDKGEITTGVFGPISSTDNAMVRWDGNIGNLVQSSLFLVDDLGNVIFFGGNIKFPVDPNPSADPNVFDDYKEFTFLAPLLFGGAAVGMIGTFAGNATKVGNRLMGDISIVLSNKGSSVGAASIPLPFTILSPAGGILYTDAVIPGANVLPAYTPSGASWLLRTVNLSNGAVGDMTNTMFENTSVIRFNFEIRV